MTDPGEGVRQARRAELKANLARVRARIEAGCARAGRSPDEVTLIVVTKTHPAEDLELLAELGVRDVGENRDQEASGKHAATAGLGLTWHFIGQLQTNKARSVAGYADLVHSVDRPGLVAALGRAAEHAGREVGCLIQVDLADAAGREHDPGRGGAPIEQLPELAALVAAQPALRLRGVMAVAPLDVDPERAFAVLPALRDRLRETYPDAWIISAGMSSDLEAALAAGATHLRVGTAVLGARPALG